MVLVHGHDLEERDGFRFRGGHRALDLTATLQGRLKATPRELLNSAEDLSRWLTAAGLPPAASARPKDLLKAKALREAIFAIATWPEEAAGDAKDTLNGIAAGAPAVPVLREGPSIALIGSADALLTSIAREAIQLFGGADSSRLRKCEGPTCAVLFFDSSRRGDRRWCSMSACGNKAKVAEHRRRRAAEASAR